MTSAELSLAPCQVFAIPGRLLEHFLSLFPGETQCKYRYELRFWGWLFYDCHTPSEVSTLAESCTNTAMLLQWTNMCIRVWGCWFGRITVVLCSCAHGKGGLGYTLDQVLSLALRALSFFLPNLVKGEGKYKGQSQVSPNHSHSSPLVWRTEKKTWEKKKEREIKEKKEKKKSSCLLSTAGITVWTATEWQSKRRLGLAAFIPLCMWLTTKAICPDPIHLWSFKQSSVCK